MPIDMKCEIKKIKRLLVMYSILIELFDIVLKDHPDIMAKAMIQTVEKNPELFKEDKK